MAPADFLSAVNALAVQLREAAEETVQEPEPALAERPAPVAADRPVQEPGPAPEPERPQRRRPSIFGEIAIGAVTGVGAVAGRLGIALLALGLRIRKAARRNSDIDQDGPTAGTG